MLLTAYAVYSIISPVLSLIWTRYHSLSNYCIALETIFRELIVPAFVLHQVVSVDSSNPVHECHVKHGQLRRVRAIGCASLQGFGALGVAASGPVLPPTCATPVVPGCA
jgi:hypothetical protein